MVDLTNASAVSARGKIKVSSGKTAIHKGRTNSAVQQSTQSPGTSTGISSNVEESTSGTSSSYA